MPKPAASLAEMLESSRLYRWRRVMRLVPAAPRCKVCSTPFRGPGRVFRLFGLGPSRKNPSMCTGCFERAPVGGTVEDVGVLFADVRGFTAFAEGTPPAEVADLLNRFYAVAREVLLRHDAVIDKLVGDEVMALFIPPLIRTRHVEELVAAAVELLEGVGYAPGDEPWLALGAGVDCGSAFVGNVGEEDVKDFTALGDVVNTAARLQSAAGPGQLVISGRVWASVRGDFPDAREVSLELKGKAEPVVAHVVDVGARAAASLVTG